MFFEVILIFALTKGPLMDCFTFGPSEDLILGYLWEELNDSMVLAPLRALEKNSLVWGAWMSKQDFRRWM